MALSNWNYAKEMAMNQWHKKMHCWCVIKYDFKIIFNYTHQHRWIIIINLVDKIYYTN